MGENHIDLRGKLQDPNRGVCAEQGDDRLDWILQRREQLVVERGLGLGGQLLEKDEENRGAHPSQEERTDQEQGGDAVMLPGVAAPPYIKRASRASTRYSRKSGTRASTCPVATAAAAAVV